MSEVKMPDNLGDQLRDIYPSNSKTAPPKSVEKERLHKVVSSKVSVQKEGLGKKFAKAFFSEDIRDVKSYIINDLFIPGIKTTLLAAMERLLFARSSGYNPWGPVNYNSIYSKQQKPTIVGYQGAVQTYGPSPFIATPKNVQGLKEIIFRSRQDAENVLNAMSNQIATYSEVSVMQYYDLCEVDSEFTDAKWGWKDLRGVRLYPVRGGYILQLPMPVVLE